jgi:hypothetical protein
MKLQLFSVLLITGIFSALQEAIFPIYSQTSTAIEEKGGEGGQEKIVGLKSHKIKADNTLIEQVQNNVTNEVNFVKIIATYYDQNGDITGTDFTFSDPYLLKPAMKAPFELSLDEEITSELGSYDLTITWRNEDGTKDSKVYEFTSANINNNQQLQTTTTMEE